ncbi:MAG: TetR/AcrR family transcriptional regulator [Microbacterium sp.]|nr:TetR/AcrR family transcriptional regulator [Microbacterium sp.]MBA4346376.1 TetR/AcrR family transcriptional regulator [Microbacterium sp.]
MGYLSTDRQDCLSPAKVAATAASPHPSGEQRRSELEHNVLVATPVDNGRPLAPAKLRILEAATALFSQEGIRAVGVDRLIQQSSVTKATFYKHFGSKDRLIQHYVAAASAATLASLDEHIAAHDSPHARLMSLVDAVHADLRHDSFRGSLFVNAAAEFPDPRDPVRIIIASHHEAIAMRVTDLLTAIGHSMPGEAADQIMVAYVGALSWGYVGDPIGASVAFRRSVERVLDDQLLAA